MTLSYAAKSRRAIVTAALAVAAREHFFNEIEEGAQIESPLPPTAEQIIDAVEERVGWNLDSRERIVAVTTYRNAKGES